MLNLSPFGLALVAADRVTGERVADSRALVLDNGHALVKMSCPGWRILPLDRLDAVPTDERATPGILSIFFARVTYWTWASQTGVHHAARYGDVWRHYDSLDALRMEVRMAEANLVPMPW